MGKKDTGDVSLLTAIHDISLWAMNRDDVPEEVDEALNLISSICRYEMPVWGDDDVKKYGIGKAN